ncbi:MAG: serine/threonine-protein phosphatase [Chloroflexi bacterium]|nr:serine/threonine-protein phosphatase [Chloroflexota bacterium]MDA0245688.1 protein phosphatase 2C domain-containing protein [Chloroflexota bacterium]
MQDADNQEDPIPVSGEKPNANDTIPTREELPQTVPLGNLPIPEMPPSIINNGLPLPAEPFIQVAQRCDVGVVRSRNEDSSFVFVSQTGGQEALLPFSLCLVADGMGGHHAGHEASRRVSREVGTYVLTQIYLPLVRSEPAAEPIRDVMLKAVEAANRSLYTPDPDKEGGTTLTAALVVGRRLYLVHVGDSRGYLLAEGKMQLLTTDHSVVQRLQEAGQITAEEAENHPHRNLLYNALTGSDLEIDTYTRSLPRQGLILLCSDGLWGSVSDAEMQAVLENSDLSLQGRANLLIDKAIAGGSTDNVTAVLMDFRL